MPKLKQLKAMAILLAIKLWLHIKQLKKSKKMIEKFDEVIGIQYACYKFSGENIHSQMQLRYFDGKNELQ